MPLVVIGTERKPNKSDLKARGLRGLPDPSPEVALLRAKLESEQAELRAMVGCYETGIPESFVRMDVDVVEVNEVEVCEGNEVEVGEGNKDVGCSVQEEKLGLESEEVPMQVAETAGKLEEKELGPCDDADKPSMPVVDGSEPGKSVRILRDRNPIQIHPYVLEREGYRQLRKAGRR